MSIPKWKRRESEQDYVDNAYNLQGDIMNLALKFSARWTRYTNYCLPCMFTVWFSEYSFFYLYKIFFLNFTNNIMQIFRIR